MSEAPAIQAATPLETMAATWSSMVDTPSLVASPMRTNYIISMIRLIITQQGQFKNKSSQGYSLV